MKYMAIGMVVVLATGIGIFLLRGEHTLKLAPMENTASGTSAVNNLGVAAVVAPSSTATGTAVVNGGGRAAGRDIETQGQLANPPAMVKGIYVTGWSAGSPKKIQSLIDLVRRTELNAIVVDIKDYSGFVSYRTGIPEVAAAGAEGELRIAAPNALIKTLHDNGIYVIGRITVFQDPILAKAYPEWAFENKTTGKTWVDSKGLAWMDPATHAVWDYNIKLAQDALHRGFDEINFDYVRFASDGTLGEIQYPSWDMKTPRHTVIKNFFAYLRDAIPNGKISADLFGLATVNHEDLGIGQVIEDAYAYFDYVSPMTYPSHYAPGFLGYNSPAKYPYEVVRYSIDMAASRLMALIAKVNAPEPSSTELAAATITMTNNNDHTSMSSSSFNGHRIFAKLRPWVQDFDLGATYTAAMVRKQIDAIDDAMKNASGTDMSAHHGGWLIWNAANNYTIGSLNPESL